MRTPAHCSAISTANVAQPAAITWPSSAGTSAQTYSPASRISADDATDQFTQSTMPTTKPARSPNARRANT